MNINIKKVLKLLILSIIILGVFSLISNYLVYIKNLYTLDTYLRIFYLDGEINIPTWFSVFLFIFASFLLYNIYIYKKDKGDIHYKKWRFLSFIFLVLSIDEASSIHEIIGHSLSQIINLTGFLHFSWVVFGLVFIFSIGLYLYKFIFSLPKKTFLFFLVSAFIFVSGAIGMEMLGGNQVYRIGSANWPYIIFSTLEEVLEKLGLVIFIYSLLFYIKTLKINNILSVD